MTIRIVHAEQDKNTFALSVEFEGHPVDLVFEATIVGNKLKIDSLHIQGSEKNTLGTSRARRFLRAFAKLCKEMTDAETVVIQGGKRTSGAAAGRIPRPYAL